jgi:hypothetical protein
MFRQEKAQPSTTSGADYEDVEAKMQRVATTQSVSSETTHHLTGSKLYLVLGGLGLAIYLFALDISVIATVPILLNLPL